ncbi:MAG: 4a-hydroxytetrahydrobiopterin dehydratase [Thiotrichales bacterium]|nr:4a-hydroxytetrahydrobiopterin dehydratase [Thiotrichales bacterium]
MSLTQQTAAELANQHCEEITKGSKSLIIPAIESNLSQLEGWDAPLNYAEINKTFSFKNYQQTIAFVNAITWLANREDHHPEICFGYNQCKVRLTTHSAKGLTMNDMIMAAKINALLD